MWTRILNLTLVVMLALTLYSLADASTATPASATDAVQPILVQEEATSEPVGTEPMGTEPMGTEPRGTEPAAAKGWEDLPPEAQAKVDPRILAELRGEVAPAHRRGYPGDADVAWGDTKPPDKTRFLVYLKSKADLETIARQRFATQTEQRTTVFDALVRTARSTQGPIQAILNARVGQGDVSSYQPFYVFNGFAVEGNLDTIAELAQREDVERIVANYPLVPLWGDGGAAVARSRDLEGLHPDNWNIDLVDADRVWDELGITGQGAVVGGIDTGVDHIHPALVGAYRGNLGDGAFDHNYNWFDPDSDLYPGGDLGASISGAPFDYGDHGTHTMGTMVGDGGQPGTQVGMAPGAKWIAISLNELIVKGSIADDIIAQKAFQWMLCPTDLSGDLTSADCSKAPDVVNVSWGSANPADDTFRPSIQALRAAGIAPVFAAGNPSAGAGSIGAPANVPEAIAVGATDARDYVPDFSGRGPSFYEGEQKPELSAPGVDVNSSVPGGGYSGPTWAGTSMAAPHVSGLVALMVSADLQDSYRDFDVDELERFMACTAVDLGAPGPDDDYGYGRIDAYNAVRWVRSAGDLRGAVHDASSGAPIEAARITGVRAGWGDVFTARSGPSGQYSTTVPAGTFEVTVGAWGYFSHTFSYQKVITGALSFADFSLTARPVAELTGRVFSGSTQVSGARVYAVDHPQARIMTDPDGTYALTLPVGSHEVAVEMNGYRILREVVSVGSSGAVHDFSMTRAPTILLVDADTFGGWFVGWPVRNFFRWSLDEEDYLYDVWPVQYLDFNDTQVMPDGSTGYGVPSTLMMGSYDLVIWAHGGGDWWPTGSPVDMGAADELMAYLDIGGRLILSGQDVGYSDHGTTFYDDYLHAEFVMDVAAGEGDVVFGSGFLDGLSLEITNASLRGYANGASDLWSDAVSPADGAAFPVLSYGNGNGGAALAVAPCDASYRAVYFALGYENVAPRAGHRDPAIAEVLDRSIDWVIGDTAAEGVSISAIPGRHTAEPGETARYDVQISNRGRTPATFELSLAGNAWPTRVLNGTTEVDRTQPLPPCGWQNLTVEVDVPDTADTGDDDTVTVTAALYPGGVPSADATVTTVAFPHWRIEAPMPTPRYRLAVATLPGDRFYYAIGGLGGSSGSQTMNGNERYDACSGQWEALAPMPTARGNVGAAAIGGKIYVPGGYAQDTILDVLEIYDPVGDSWSAGARLPEPLTGAAVAAWGGKLYTFGGKGRSGSYVDKTYQYDPVADRWVAKAPLPGGGRAYATAAELDGKIYVVGGWSNRNTVEVYDPREDSWSSGAPMNVGRQSPGLAAALDGYLYVSGGGDGWDGLASAERYDPDADTWEMIPSLSDSRRAGSASAFAAGRLFAVGGTALGASSVNESLRLYDNLCHSQKLASPHLVQPGGRIAYMVEIHSDAADVTGVSIVDPIPAGTTFAGFGANPIGAVYDDGDGQVKWDGTIPGGADPMTFTFDVHVASGGWVNGDIITNVLTLDDGAGRVFTRAVASVVTFPDASPSFKHVDKDQALAGDVLTYTIRVENGSAISDVFGLSDPIPADVTYVPGSLAYTSGIADYNAGDRAITWMGTLPDGSVYVNTSGDYEWGDSDGNGDVPGVTYEWIDATGGSEAIDGFIDDGYAGPFDIGFSFKYYGIDYTQFYVNSNGSIQFGGGYAWYDGCPIDLESPNNAIHLLGGDRVVDGSSGRVYYQTFDAAEGRYTVIEFHQLRNFGGSEYSNLEVILYENGAIRLQYKDMAGSMTAGTIGLDDDTGIRTIEYLDVCPASVHDDLAVLLLPDGASWSGISSFADISFAVTTAEPLPINTWITNTATIDGSVGDVVRRAGTCVNSVDLSGSWKKVDENYAAVGDTVHYDLFVENTGLLTATEATLIDLLPSSLAYVSGSLTWTLGTAGYEPEDRAITWIGTLPSLVGYARGPYEWGDSDGRGTLPGVTYDWIEISDTGMQIPFNGVDNNYFYPVPLPFLFNFYDVDYDSLAVATNGTVYFQDRYLGYSHTPVPASNSYQVDSFVAHLWNDLYVSPGAVYYEVQGDAPDRRMVIEYYQVSGCCPSPDHATWEIVLYESGDILLQYRDVTFGNARDYGAAATVGVQNSPTEGLQYSYNTPALSDGLAILFSRKSLVPVYSDSAEISFSAVLTEAPPGGTVVTNVASLDDGHGKIYDLEADFLARNADLSGSFKQVEPSAARPGDTVTYTVFVRNVGGGATTGEMRDQLPPGLTYRTGSLVCGTGSCGYVSGAITWTGTLVPRSLVPVRFQASLPLRVHSGGLIVNTAVVTDVVEGVGYRGSASVRVIGRGICLPLVMRND